MTDMLNLGAMPKEPIRRLMWLSGVNDQVKVELDAAYQQAYFQARQQGLLDQALSLGIHSRKRVMAFTRHENERTGRQWRWGDGRG